MSKELSARLAIMVALTLVLLIPLQMVSSLVDERQGRQQEALAGIQQSVSGAQRIAGPVLVLPYKVRSEEKIQIKEQREFKVMMPENGQMVEKSVTREVVRDELKVTFTDKQREILPQVLKMDGKVATQSLYRGLYVALTYDADLKINGSFDVNAVDLADNPSVTFGTPYLAIGVGDVRGIRKAPQVKWAGRDRAVEAGNFLSQLGPGVHVPLPDLTLGVRATLPFDLALPVQGMESLYFSPLGKDTRVSLRADWPHPSFTGHFLPATREIDEHGFNAQWQTSWFATNMPAAFTDEGRKVHTDREQDFGVKFIQPVDTYQQTDRSIKYGVLFVLLTFTAVFVFELMRRLRVHPVQYLLVGAALAVFFLLLIALSEHIPFAYAYLTASVACVALIGFYLAFVLRHWQRGTGFGALLGLLYAALYGMMCSEDNALLLGSGLLFGVLALVMVLTRRLDWYSIGKIQADNAPISVT